MIKPSYVEQEMVNRRSSEGFNISANRTEYMVPYSTYTVFSSCFGEETTVERSANIRFLFLIDFENYFIQVQICAMHPAICTVNDTIFLPK